MLPLSPSFDMVGAFGQTAQAAAFMAPGYAADRLRIGAPPVGAPRIMVLEGAMLARQTQPRTAAAVAGLAVSAAPSPVALEDILLTHRQVLLAEAGRTHARLDMARISPRLAADIAIGLAISDADYHAALRRLAAYRREFWAGFGPQDFLLMPAAPNVAPADGTTGDPSYVIPTTALGGPVATLRAGLDGGMPVGALLFAAPGADAALAGFLFSEVASGLDL